MGASGVVWSGIDKASGVGVQLSGVGVQLSGIDGSKWCGVEQMEQVVWVFS